MNGPFTNVNHTGTLKIYDDQYYTITGNPENVTVNVRLRLQGGAIGEAWIGWGNTGLEFTGQGANITKLRTGTDTTSLSSNVRPTDWHEYKLVRTLNQLSLYVDNQLITTKYNYNSNWSTGSIKFGGICPYTICTSSKYMELDWVEVTTSNN